MCLWHSQYIDLYLLLGLRQAVRRKFLKNYRSDTINSVADPGDQGGGGGMTLPPPHTCKK